MRNQKSKLSENPSCDCIDPAADYLHDDQPVLLPTFSFFQFVGLDGFDPSSCKWLTDTATQVGPEPEEPARKFPERQSRIDDGWSNHNDLLDISRSVVKDITGSLSRKLEKYTDGCNVRLPHILDRYHYPEKEKKGRRPFPRHGKLVYEEPKVFPAEDIFNKLRKVNEVSRSRNVNIYLDMRGTPCKLPPISQSSSVSEVNHEQKDCRFPCIPRSRDSSGRLCKNIGLPWRRKNGTVRQEVPPNVFGYRGEVKETAPTLVRKCGGGGFATTVDIDERKESERALLESMNRRNSFPQLKGKSSCTSVISTRSWKA